MIFQDPYQSLNPQLSVLDTISEPLIIHKIGDGKARENAVLQTMKSVGLSPPHDFAHRFPHQSERGTETKDCHRTGHDPEPGVCGSGRAYVHA